MLDSQFEDKYSVSFISCDFETNKKSRYAIFYVRGNNGVSIELNKCIFRGQLNSNAHYIDGKFISENSPKLAINSCKFAFDSKRSLNLSPENNFMNVDLKNQQFNFDDITESKSISRKWKLIVAILVPTCALVAIIIIISVVVKKRKNGIFQFDRNEMSIEANELFNNSLNQPLI